MMCFKKEKYPKAMIDLARERTKGLCSYSLLLTQPLSLLIESAYLQGVCDAAEAIKPDEELKKESES